MKLIIPTHIQVSKKKRIPLSLSWYRNSHFFESNKAKKIIKEIVKDQLTEERFDGYFMTSLTFNYNRADQDIDNFTSVAKKFVLDALTEYGVIQDDCVKYHIETRAVLGEKKKEGEIIFEIV